MNTMNIFEFLAYLRSLNIKLSLKEERLFCKAEPGILTKSLQEEIKKRKGEIIAILQQHQQKQSLKIESIPRESEIPLSFVQERLWKIEQKIGKNYIYNIHRIFSLEGNLEISALEQAIIALIQRHDILRTNFIQKQQKPTLIIHPEINFTLPIINLEKLTQEEQNKKIDQIIETEIYYLFDLEKDQLIRFKLLQKKSSKYILILVIHHIISDGWSMNVLGKELSQLYHDFRNNHSSNLLSLPIQYADFILWQRNRLTGEILEKQINYWRKQLQGIPPLLELPLDKPRPAVQTFIGQQSSLNLAPSITSKLKALAQSEQVTLYVILLATFGILLSRYSGQLDIVIGSPIANRNFQILENLIGLFTHNLPFRISLAGNPFFKELLTRVNKIALEAYNHQDLPFGKLVEELNPERNSSYTPIFQVALAMQNTCEVKLESEDFKVELIEAPKNIAKYDLTLFIREKDDHLRCTWQYNVDLFNDDTIVRMKIHFQKLLEEIVSNPQQKISQIPLLTESEKNKLLIEWNQTQKDYYQNKCIHHLFEEQVEKKPNSVAVIFGENKLTYKQLNEKSNKLAHYLQKIGVKTETIVGIYIERSLEMIIGLLGILKVGGAYLPLDTNYPQDRLYFMIEDTQIKILLTQKSLSDQLPSEIPNIIYLDDANIFQQENTTNPANKITGENLVYVIYTSGSTGKPKGVMMSHGAIANLIQWQINRTNFANQSRALQFSPISFDVSCQEIFSTLCSGGTLIIISETQRQDFSNLPQFLEKNLVQRLFLPFVALEMLSEVIETKKQFPLSLQEIITTGEQFKITPSVRNLGIQIKTIYNQYGPTETHVTTEFIWHSEQKNQTYLPPIGRPISNHKIYLLDEQLQPVPIGVRGEIYIGGMGLARGYLNHTKLTAEKFIPNPFGEGRLYKTGDLARYLPDGNIQFIGRIDNQVKIRGFRIELGEVEATLAQHPKIKETVIIAREHQQGENYLVAYILLFDSFQPSLKDNDYRRELREFLQQKLPEYMIPSAFVFLDSFPLTPSGKIDRNALPEPDFRNPNNIENNLANSDNQIETILAQIWQEVLGIEKIGINDNFFDLGGNSLISLKLISRIEKNLGINIPVNLLFLAPTIAELAVSIEQNLNTPIVQKNNSASVLENTSENYSPFLHIERCPLLSLFATGKIAPVDAVALGYVSPSWHQKYQVSAEDFLKIWGDNLPFLGRIIQTHWGRIGIITLPHLSTELYNNSDSLLESIIEALHLSKLIGARVVSLTGLIPSATNYGLAIADKIYKEDNLPKITTGHGTTSATILLNINHILEESGRILTQERVGFIGLGSIGIRTLRLMLKCLPHPPEIILCDLYSKQSQIEAISQELIQDFGFTGKITIAISRPNLPPEIYQATLIIGATNVPDLLDINLLQPGTLIVDDSAPHCFSEEAAIKRFQEQEDILFTEGGVLYSPLPQERLLYIPPVIPPNIVELTINNVSQQNPHNITGCILSSLLTAQFEKLKPTLGIVNIRDSELHYQTLTELGFRAADLHCREYILPKISVENFRNRYGNKIS